MHQASRNCPFPHRRGNTPDRGVSNVAGRKDAGDARFEQERVALEPPTLCALAIPGQILTGENEAGAIAFDHARHQLRMRDGANKEKQRRGGYSLQRAIVPRS